MTKFAAIDFETANRERSSVCSVGIIIVDNGEIVDSYYSLIRPEPNFYDYFCTEIHGLTSDDTNTAPTFDIVWGEVEQVIEGLPLVAHNMVFDHSCIVAAHKLYKMDLPDYDIHCTCQTARKMLPNLPNHKLPTVAEHLEVSLDNHHNALADAEACAEIAIKLSMFK